MFLHAPSHHLKKEIPYYDAKLGAINALIILRAILIFS
jgi:hypothetical protein